MQHAHSSLQHLSMRPRHLTPRSQCGERQLSCTASAKKCATSKTRRCAECSDASKDDDSEGDSQQRGSEYDDEDMEDLIGDFLTSFVTSPDFERGFKWSGKTQSHIHLENVNHGLRRRLAATLLSVERARSAGGLLNSGYVLDRALDRINELGQQADDLCAECAAAKRGTADLTRRTERTQHCVSMLHRCVALSNRLLRAAPATRLLARRVLRTCWRHRDGTLAGAAGLSGSRRRTCQARMASIAACRPWPPTKRPTACRAGRATSRRARQRG